MKLFQDSRINVNSLSIRNYIIAFACVDIVCGCWAVLYLIQSEAGRLLSEYYSVYLIAPVMFAYLVVCSAAVLIAYAIVRKKKFIAPLEQLSIAAKRVSEGDYSYRIPPRRRDGKKDEFEVLYDDFNTMAAELASTEMMKKDFISNVSHELKTPLSVIQNYAAILQDPTLSDEERMDYSARILDASERLTVLVSNILQLSRIENKKIVAKQAPFNLSEQLCRCALTFEREWEEKDIAFEIDLDQSITLTSDEELLDIVWNNLISNALKFTPDGGTVALTAKREEAEIIVTVSDTGCGIEEGAIRHIFDKFYQADLSHAVSGNGLGLALVREVLNLIGGSIAVDSTPGKGSVFTVSLPAGGRAGAADRNSY